ncbi:serine/threonine kinase [Fragilaria crotonensis]|nr:serine/threonine kinase [Fragilaria crotonensis]
MRKRGNLDKVRDLLRRGANVNAKNVHGDTALIEASQSGHLEVVRALLEHNGVDVNIQTNYGSTALTWASQKGHLEVVRALLMHNGVDVNFQNKYGMTALIYASYYGHLEVVCALLNHDGVDVNTKNMSGDTALIWASFNGHLEVVRALLDHEGVDVNSKESNGKTALDIAREKTNDAVARLLEEHMEREKLRKENERNPRKKHTTETPASEEKRPSSTDVPLDNDQELLLHVMNTSSADPAELSLEYIKRCIKKDSDDKPIILGSGGYGDVFLAEDSRLRKKFAVKMINPTKHDQDTIEDIRTSFQTELSTLKRFRHPNIIVLYGYSLNPSSTQQCLVYEYVANGSLADFLHHHGKTARLSANIRLSIMFELTRAVHFLHTGGCKVVGKGWEVFHRDIKSANICLAEDFTPRLIDCGLAKFVRDSNATPGAVTLKSTNRNGTFGTPGYMCPEYSRKKGAGHPCPYIAAYDVYSIGVVMVELVLGSLTGGQSTQNDSQFLDVYEKYVMNDHHQRIDDGCGKLKLDADRTIIWNPVSLELVCKAAIQCMDPVSGKRLRTKDLLGELNRAIQINAGLRSSEPEGAAGGGCLCDVCNLNCASMKCSEGHALCSSCIEKSLLNAPPPGIGRCPLMCLINECSVVLQDEDLCRNINVGLFIKYILNREIDSPASTSNDNDIPELLKNLKISVDEIHAGQKGIKKVVDDSHAWQKKLATGLNWALGALSLLTANEFKECPNLVLMTPSSFEEKDWSNPKNWVEWVGNQQFRVVFVCFHSHQPGHEAFEISVTREWIVKAAPWLLRCLQLLTWSAKVNKIPLPIPIPSSSVLDQCKRLKEFYDSLKEEGTQGPMTTLEGDAFKVIAERRPRPRIIDCSGTVPWFLFSMRTERQFG